MSEPKKQQIMEVAERLFAARRIHEVTLDEVAGAAAVSKGTIYRFFADKDDLIFQVALSGFDDLCRLVQEQCGDGEFEQRLLHVCEQISAFFERRRRWFELVHAQAGCGPWAQGTLRDRWMATRQRLVDAVANVIDQGVRSGRVQGEPDCRVLASLLLGMLRTRAQDLGSDGNAVPRGHAWLVQVFLEGCGGRRGGNNGRGASAAPSGRRNMH